MRFTRIAVGLLLGSVAVSAGAKMKAAPQVTILEQSLNRELPSASALATTSSGYVAVGDDSPWLYQLDPHFNITQKTMLKDYPVGPDGRIPKAIKPDFESMATFSLRGNSWQLILSSGSKAIVRELAILLSADGTQRFEKQVSSFYAQLATAAGMPAGKLVNLEGLATTENYFFLLNRVNSGGNVVFKIEKESLFDYLIGKSASVSGIKAYHVTMPAIEGYEAGLSGADFVSESETLIFTSSVEVTNDPIRDGQILGSFIGALPTSALKEGMDLTPYTTLVTGSDGKPLITKMESISAIRSSGQEIEAAVASDNDNGTSEFFRVLLRKN